MVTLLATFLPPSTDAHLYGRKLTDGFLSLLFSLILVILTLGFAGDYE
jgi:hypothetical protein